MTLPRLDAVAAREYTTGQGETKTSFTRVGVALPTKRGDGYTLLLDAMPAPTEGQFRILLMPPKSRDGQAPQHPQQAQEPGGYAPPLDDSIPFMPCR